MDERPVIWDRANRKHIEKDHPDRKISVTEVEEAMNDAEREEAIDPKRPDNHAVRGSTLAGRRLYVVWVDHLDGRYPIHAHQIGRRGR